MHNGNIYTCWQTRDKESLLKTAKMMVEYNKSYYFYYYYYYCVVSK